ncbi:MAG TPA: hypothetical protein VGJ21_00640 [Terracidiphilus sp.]|jgi:hypothetical protein
MVRAIWHAIFLSIFFCALPLAAQEVSAGADSRACGDPATKFDVKRGDAHTPIQPVDGMAVVVVVEDDTNFNSVPKPVTRIGMDGQWVSATHGNSFTSFLVSPGKHNLCASWQSGAALGLAGATSLKKMSRRSSVHEVDAQAGQIYYFQVKNVFISPDQAPDIVEIHLAPVDNGEGHLLTSDRTASHATMK